MATLERLLAQAIVDALVARELVLLHDGAQASLRKELASLVAPRLPSITQRLGPGRARARDVASTFGDETVDEDVERLVDEVRARLMESNHVDDIFGDDHLIRRHAFVAVRDVLYRYTRGELAVDESEEPPGSWIVALERLGYLAAVVVERADPEALRAALARAAESVGAKLATYDATRRSACFRPPRRASGARLRLEEAITEELLELVDSDAVELPSVEQALEVPAEIARHPGLQAALERAARETQLRTGCATVCTMVDERTLLASLTPLTDEDAERADEHFNSFVDALERALGVLDEARTSAPPPASQERRRASRPPAAAPRQAGRRS
jgi:hypothetical protein